MSFDPGGVSFWEPAFSGKLVLAEIGHYQIRPLWVRTNPNTHSTIPMLAIMTHVGELGGGTARCLMAITTEHFVSDLLILVPT
jgi:hypothetical protein